MPQKKRHFSANATNSKASLKANPAGLPKGIYTNMRFWLSLNQKIEELLALNTTGLSGGSFCFLLTQKVYAIGGVQREESKIRELVKTLGLAGFVNRGGKQPGRLLHRVSQPM